MKFCGSHIAANRDMTDDSDGGELCWNCKQSYDTHWNYDNPSALSQKDECYTDLWVGYDMHCGDFLNFSSFEGIYLSDLQLDTVYKMEELLNEIIPDVL